MALASCQCNKAGLRMPCAQEGGGFVCGRCGLRISQTHVAAYPECAEKDAEIARLRAVLERIGGPESCGCGPICSCNAQAELLIWKEEAKSAANEALKGGAQMKALGEVVVTERGFELIEFADKYGDQCELQQSSLTEYYDELGASAVWLGLAGDNPRIHPAFGTSLGMRMHLDRKRVVALIGHLQSWLRTGSFDKAPKKKGGA